MNKKSISHLGILLIIIVMITPVTVVGEDTDLKNSISIFGNIRPMWLQKVKLTASDAGIYEAFGSTVCISGDYAFIGSPYDDTSAGSVYVFKRTNGVWTQQTKLQASDAEPYSTFGFSISADENYVLISGGGSGPVYVFKRDGTSWIEQSRLTPSDGEPNDAFGLSISLSGNYALIGAPYENNQNGSVYIFKRDGTTWTQEAKLSLFLPHSPHGAEFGRAVSLYGDYALIGAPLDEYSVGSAHIFKRTGSTWILQETLIPSDGDTYDWFGYSVSIHGDFALIGALTNDLGAAYMFKQSGTHWTQTQKLLANDGDGGGFGTTVSLSKNYALFGSPGKNHGEGAAYVFKRTDTIWRKENKLTASDGIAEIYFGWSVSISGDTALIGAPDFNWGTGSAYVFQHA
ncbi:MAG: FG-GAP repeat protein [Methanobacteriota archaeon]